jgi:cytosine/adenosine deaminase-related metal-dependent hydrolase
LVFQNAQVLTCDAGNRVLSADVAVEGDRIVAVGADLRGTRVIDLRGKWLLPGFVQTHVHLVQTLFRGLADDLLLLDWLRTRIWPFERAHDLDSVYASARLGITELLAGGTTAILDMATVHHTDAVFTAAAEAGIRLWCGAAMMDRDNEAGLSLPTDASLRAAGDLADRWHGRGLLRYAYAPRFVPSCSDTLLRECVREARARGCLLHTHASENRDEVALVRSLVGTDNVLHLDRLGFTGPDVALAHCIHLTEEEERVLADTGTRVLHCPSSNLKLGSGVARIPELLAKGVHVSLGADGAPCNNRLDMFAEMRLAALVQKPRLDPRAMPAPLVLRMATASGAEALGFPGGVIAPGNVADLVVLDPDRVWGGGDPHGAVVYALDARAVCEVWVAGVKVAEEGRVLAWDTAETVSLARTSLGRVRARASVEQIRA